MIIGSKEYFIGIKKSSIIEDLSIILFKHLIYNVLELLKQLRGLKIYEVLLKSSSYIESILARPPPTIKLV